VLDNNAIAIIRAGDPESSQVESDHKIDEETVLSPGAAFNVALDAERTGNAFLLDYVIHAADGIQGSHSIEVVLQSLDLLWPYLHDLQLVFDIVEVYSNFVFITFACPFIIDTSLRPWFFVNIVLRQAQLLVVSPHVGCVLNSQSQAAAWAPAVLLHWQRLRVGYDWAGKQESVLVVNAEGLGAKLVKDLRPDQMHSSWRPQHIKVPPTVLLLPFDLFLRFSTSKYGTGAAVASKDITATRSYISAPSVQSSKRSTLYGEDSESEETCSKRSLKVICSSVLLQLPMSGGRHLRSLVDVFVRAASKPSAQADETASSTKKTASLHHSESMPLFPPAAAQLAASASMQSAEQLLSKDQHGTLRGSTSSMTARSQTGHTDVQSSRSQQGARKGAARWLLTPIIHYDLRGSGAAPCDAVSNSDTIMKRPSTEVSRSAVALHHLWPTISMLCHQSGVWCRRCGDAESEAERHEPTCSRQASECSFTRSVDTGKIRVRSEFSLQVCSSTCTVLGQMLHYAIPITSFHCVITGFSAILGCTACG
jgi:hypothetical protein